MVEIVISIVAFLIILAFTRLGMHFGAFYELAGKVVQFLATDDRAFGIGWLFTRLLSPWFNGRTATQPSGRIG